MTRRHHLCNVRPCSWQPTDKNCERWQKSSIWLLYNIRNMIRFEKYDENLCLNDKIYRMMIVLYDKICKRWQKGILQNLNEIWFLLNLINEIGFTIISLWWESVGLTFIKIWSTSRILAFGRNKFRTWFIRKPFFKWQTLICPLSWIYFCLNLNTIYTSTTSKSTTSTTSKSTLNDNKKHRHRLCGERRNSLRR